MKRLWQFREALQLYFAAYSASRVSFSDSHRHHRVTVNLQIHSVYSMVQDAGIDTSFSGPHRSSSVTLDRKADLVLDVFSLVDLNIDPQYLGDCIVRAIGKYNDDRARAVLRTINPLFWAGKLVDAVLDLPLKLLRSFGIKVPKIEDTLAGRVIGGLLKSVTYLAAFLTVAEKLGYLETFKGFLKSASP